MFNSILVLESSWEENTIKSTSTWPFVSGFATVANIEAYHRIFTDKDSFEKWVRVFNKDRSIGDQKLLYIASHGSLGRIAGINRQTICNLLSKCHNIKYVHFGSCLFGQVSNLEWVLDNNRHLKWTAGYECEVDWIDSTLFDLLMWNRIYRIKPDDKESKFIKPIKKLLSETIDLNKNLEFNFVYRKEDKTIEVLNSVLV
ncbi:MAG: hypothetical protein ACM3MI_14945 [Clostridiales bacterium]